MTWLHALLALVVLACTLATARDVVRDRRRQNRYRHRRLRLAVKGDR